MVAKVFVFHHPRKNPRSMVDPPRARPPQVFVNLGTTQLPHGFIRHLVLSLADLGIFNIVIDKEEWLGRNLDHIYTCIEESTIALVIFSSLYPETEWCLDELVKMKQRANENKLFVIPIFYNVSKNDVRNLEGEFGDRFREMRQRYTKYKYDPFRVQRWETSLTYISRMEPCLTWEAQSSNITLVADIIREVKRKLDVDADPRRTKVEIVGVFASAFIVAFVFSLFIARLTLTYVNIFMSVKWLVGFPVTIVVLLQFYCSLT